MPMKSQVSITGLLEPSTQAVQVSTWPIGIFFAGVEERAERTFLM